MKRLNITLLNTNYDNYLNAEIEADYHDEIENGSFIGTLKDYRIKCIQEDLLKFFNNIGKSKFNDNECFISQKIGDFSQPIEKCINLSQAIRKCLQRSEKCIIKQINGFLEVVNIQENKTINYNIYLLSDRGKKANLNKLINPSNRKAIDGYLIDCKS